MAKISMPHFSLDGPLSDEQQQFFDKHGVIQFKGFISRDQVASLLADMKRLEQQWISEGRTKVNGVPLKFGKDTEGNPIIQRFCFVSQYSDEFREIIRDSRLQNLLSLLEPYEGRIGEDEKDGLVLNNYLRTPTSVFSQMGWHTDAPRDLFLGQRIMPMLNVGVHLDDCPYSNGGLRVIPGTHKQGMLRMLFGKRYFVDNDPDRKEIGFDIEAGDLTVHEGRVWHRVEQSPNIGEKSRRRVMYIPIITGKYNPKHESSKTPIYHRFKGKALKGG